MGYCGKSKEIYAVQPRTTVRHFQEHLQHPRSLRVAVAFVVIIVILVVSFVFLFVLVWLLPQEDIDSHRPIKKV